MSCLSHRTHVAAAPKSAPAIAAAFVAVPAAALSDGDILYPPPPPDDECRHTASHTAPSDPFLGSFPLRIAACPERLFYERAMSACGQVRTPGFARWATSAPTMKTLLPLKVRFTP